MIKAVIIDDERNSRDIISLMLEKYCPQVEIVATASDCADGIATIKKCQPDLVFLDLEMPDGTGFDVLLGTQDVPLFEAVFVTAFEKKFLHTIRFSEVEIILKPIDRESLTTAIAIIAARIHAGVSKDRYKLLMSNFNKGRNATMDLLLPQGDSDDKVIPLADVTYLEALGDRTVFYMDSHQQVQSTRPFRYYADLFANLRFYQVNNLQMVQMGKIVQVEGDGGKVVMHNGAGLEIAERRKKDLLLHMKQYK